MSDHLAIARAYEGWAQSGRSYEYARKYFLSAQTLQQIAALREQLRRQLHEAGFAAGGGDSSSGGNSGGGGGDNVNTHTNQRSRLVLCRALTDDG